LPQNKQDFYHMKNEQQEDNTNSNRRKFLSQVGGVIAATVALGAVSVSAQTPEKGEVDGDDNSRHSLQNRRRNNARKIRRDAAHERFEETANHHPTNGDENLYANKIGNYSKTMPHDANGVVAGYAYNALLNAMQTGNPTDFDAIPQGGTAKQANPQGALAFSLDSADSNALTIAVPPAYASETEAAEMAEVYWQAVTRDVSFADYATDATIGSAVNDLNRFARFSGVTRNSIFRGQSSGDLVGPYISQFLYKPIPQGPRVVEQKLKVPVANVNFMTNYSEWLNVQNGFAPTGAFAFDPTTRFIRNGRDLGEWVHRDYSFQGFLDAALILLSFGGGALADTNPYKTSVNQGGFVQFGGPHVLDMVSRAGLLGLKAAWFQKWSVHRRLRPEAFAGDVHNKLVSGAVRPIHPKLLSSPVLPLIFNQTGSYLLPMAFAEGSPAHPAFPSGHATIAGACTTILKAFFKESFVVPNSVVPSPDGLSLTQFAGTLTVGNELNKLAANISIGRDTAGVHWRSDGIEGMNLGEEVAISLLKDYKETYNENFAGFTFTRFNGSSITI
jgi:membrane-associated phospholipid phosphatase